MVVVLWPPAKGIRRAQRLGRARALRQGDEEAHRSVAEDHEGEAHEAGPGPSDFRSPLQGSACNVLRMFISTHSEQTSARVPSRFPLLYYIILYYIICYRIVLYYIISYYAMLCYVMLCYVMLYDITPHYFTTLLHYIIYIT